MPRESTNVSMTDASDVIGEFATALAGAGLILRGPPVMDGKLRRVPVTGDRPGRRSGAYVGHLDGMPAGHITNWKTGLQTTWKSFHAPHGAGQESRRSPLWRTNIQDRVDAKRAAVARRQARTSRYAARLWDSAGLAPYDHPYLVRKGVAAHGLRISKADCLLIPAHDIDGRLWSLTRIMPDGTKLFLRGGRIEGCHYTIGTLDPWRPILIAEGFATAATLHEISDLPTVAAMTSGNLSAVARVIRSRYQHARIIIAGDNDHRLPDQEPPMPNVGKLKAEEAARDCGGISLIPTFEPEDLGTDWNDLAASHGAEAVRAQLAARAELGRYLELGEPCSPGPPAGVPPSAASA
jgi:phage/plasmid primase-like uncharacterized protein